MPIEALFRAHCDRCHSVESCMWHGSGAASEFARRRGWVVDMDRVLCPKCVDNLTPIGHNHDDGRSHQ